MRDVFTLPRIARARLLGVSLIIIAVLTLAPSFASRADNYETLDQSFEFKTGGTVKIDSGLGGIKIEVWAEELVHITARKVEPAGHPVALSDMAFFNTKNLLTIKSQPSDATTKIDIIVYVPRNTNLRITTTAGDVQVRGAISSAMIETKTGNITLESPPSQNADVVLTTTMGKVRSSLPIEPYGTPTIKSVQGKLGEGGNPVIMRSSGGNIQICALERETDQDIATIPSAPPATSSSDSSSNYRGYGNSNNDDTLFGNNDSPQLKPRPKQNSQPYTYGGSYGGSNPPPDNSGSGGSRPGRANTDVFGGGRDTDESGSSIDLNSGPGKGRTQNDNDIKGSFGVRIIPPPGGSSTRDDDSDDLIYHDRPYPSSQQQPRRSTPPDKLRNQRNGNNSNQDNQPDQPPPLQPRRSTNPDDDQGQNPRSQNTRPDSSRTDDQDQSAGVYPDDTNDTKTPNSGSIERDQPVLRRGAQNGTSQNSGPRNNTTRTSGGDDEGTIKIDTKLVTLNVSAMDRGGRAITNLKSENFEIFEDGVQQQISHFEPVHTPFNLILLIDLSGSIIEKIDILRRAAIRFIDVTRPEDKVAVVAFTRSVQVVSDFTSDRQLLRQRLQYMHMPKGGTAFYEALWFTTSQLLKSVEGERNAIVLLTDGVDNSISVTYPIPSRVTFEQVMRKVQETAVLVFPIYLDTEFENVEQEIETPESYVLARRQLSTLAEASGGVFIKAERVENLEGVYEKVAADLRTLYSVGYYPTNSSRDGTWRKIKVKIDKADVAVRTRRGYIAK